MAKPGAGDDAPDFTLAGTDGRTYSSADYRGAPLLLIFYPGDDTPVCTRQLKEYSSDFAQLEDLGAHLLALSPQSAESHDTFSCKHRFRFPLLADVGMEVGRAYGIVGPLGFYRRSVFLVDGDGVIRYAHRGLTGLTYQRTDALVAAVQGLAREA